MSAIPWATLNCVVQPTHWREWMPSKEGICQRRFVRKVVDAPLSEVIQGQVGHGSEQLDLVDNVPVQSRWDRLNDP